MDESGGRSAQDFTGLKVLEHQLRELDAQSQAEAMQDKLFLLRANTAVITGNIWKQLDSGTISPLLESPSSLLSTNQMNDAGIDLKSVVASNAMLVPCTSRSLPRHRIWPVIASWLIFSQPTAPFSVWILCW